MQEQNIRFSQFHISHPIPGENDIQNVFESFIAEYKNFRNNVPVGCITDKCSSKQQERIDLSVFCGAGGYLYLYLRIYEFVSSLSPELQQQCTQGLTDQELSEFYNPETFLQMALQQYQAIQASIKADDNISFFMSNSAISLLGADMFFYMKDKENFKRCVTEVLNQFGDIVAQPKKYEQELLYGVPGYLYSLLWLHKKYSNEKDQFQLDLSSHIHTICQVILKFVGNGVMKCQFSNRQYYGAAHGILGVYFHLKDEQGLLQMLESIQVTLDHLIKIYYQNGNIPSSAQNEKNLRLFQFCHGIPGAFAPILKAYQIFNKQDYLDAAIHMSETLFKYGMIKKGYGLCHGIPGNSYGFMQLYRLTGSEKLRQYAFQFLQYKKNPHVYNEIKNFPFKDRFNIGISDNPFSLMMGSIGDMCAMMDFINYKRMPGYEI
ncbi:unnamed protein product (macronuclear) [Paramecium tetraurelia]|uniref:Lanthionine synthetase C-like protein n=1 Tax=Paramecium tetraurelia TaxID=5888 RepID=A0DLY9_PARTE|nr:uncharacterized protein GSPATT00018274001 [Paramecium tetraurelia]CAK84056.1 unnamed protein product [Paramecium tetraurelia]|eukprot:XP_001451453.1 hypothetical protein (macronuclear) [Paramecium tetraurelia strain d4-2]